MCARRLFLKKLMRFSKWFFIAILQFVLLIIMAVWNIKQTIMKDYNIQSCQWMACDRFRQPFLLCTTFCSFLCTVHCFLCAFSSKMANKGGANVLFKCLHYILSKSLFAMFKKVFYFHFICALVVFKNTVWLAFRKQKILKSALIFIISQIAEILFFFIKLISLTENFKVTA